jgi:hypothetical protein
MNHSYEQLIAPRLLDSRLKLHLMLQFLNHPQLVTSAVALSERLRENPWAVADALEELAASHLLANTAQLGTPFYRLGSDLLHYARLERLLEAFNDPHLRDRIHDLVADADRERQYFAMLADERTVGLPMALVA